MQTTFSNSRKCKKPSVCKSCNRTGLKILIFTISRILLDFICIKAGSHWLHQTKSFSFLKTNCSQDHIIEQSLDFQNVLLIFITGGTSFRTVDTLRYISRSEYRVQKGSDECKTLVPCAKHNVVSNQREIYDNLTRKKSDHI